jgi:transcription elongation factor GreB
VSHYLTREGARRLQDELARLRSVDRPKVVSEVADAAAQGDRSENAEYIYGKKKLREIDRRIHFLTKRLETCTVVDPGPHPSGKVFFGAEVEVEDEDGNTACYRVLDEDEIDAQKRWISFRSPLGRALLGKGPGDLVRFRKPSGEVELTVIAVRYPLG